MQWNETTPLSPANLNDLENRINTANANVVAGKQSVFDAIQSKGQTANSKEFQDLVLAINRFKIAGGNVLEGHVLNGYTFTNADGVLRTGSIPIRGANTNAGSYRAMANGNLYVSIPKGAYLQITPVANAPEITIIDGNFKPENIKKDVKLFGVTGTLPTECIEKIQKFEFTCDDRSKDVDLGTQIDWSRSIIVPTKRMRERSSYSNQMVRVVNERTVNVTNRCSNASYVSFKIYTFYADAVRQSWHGHKNYSSSEMDVDEKGKYVYLSTIENPEKCLAFATGVVHGSSYECGYTPRAYPFSEGIDVYGIYTAGRYPCDLAWSVLEFK